MSEATHDAKIASLVGDMSWHPSLARVAVRAALFAESEPLQFGRYKWLRPLGAGGMGTVIVAHDPLLDREVAIKLALAPDPRLRAKVVREAQAHARVTHPNVAAVYDVGVAGPRVYIVMELVAGRDLAQWSATRSWRAIALAWLEIADGVAAVHAADLVHLDVKPSNAMMGADGRARLIDFGIARVLALPTPSLDGTATDDETERTERDPRAGTPAYMAPEQLLGENVDARADQFAWCVAVWEALTGARPGDTLPAMAALDGPWPPPLPSTPEVPREVWRVLARGLAADPAARFASMQELATAMRRSIGGRRLRARIGAGAVVGAATLGLWSLVPRADNDACAEVDAYADATWDIETREGVERHLLATAPTLHANSWQRVDAAMTEWVGQWQETQRSACETGAANPAAARCLTWALADVHAIVDVLARGDAAALSREIDRALVRPPPSRCLDTATLALAPPIPPPSLDAEVAAVRERLREAERQEARGEYVLALAITEAAVADSAAIDFEPLQVECKLALGDALGETGPYDRARAILEDAFTSADRLGYTVVAAKAAAQLATVVGVELRDVEGAELWTARALTTARATGDAELLADAEKRVASAKLAIGRAAEARELFEGVHARLTRECPAPCARLIEVDLELSSLLEEQGEHVAALDYARAGLALARETVGDAHLHTGAAHNQLCAVLMRGGEYEEAKQNCTLAWEITRGVFGDEHTDTAAASAMLASVEMTMGDLDVARPRLERAHAVFERLLGAHHRQTQAAASNLALLAMYTGDHAAAKRGFEAVLVALEADPSASAAELVTIHHALGQLGNDMRDWEGGAHHLERAIAIGVEAGHSAELMCGLRTKLGVALVELDRLVEAQAVLTDAIASESELDEAYNGALRRCTLARALVATDRAKATRLVDEALRKLGDESPELAARCNAVRDQL